MKTKPLLFLLLAFLYDAVLYWYIYTRLPDGAKRADILGLCSSLVTTVIMTLPAIEVIGNIRLKNADGMPLIMLLGTLACCACWLVYGLLLDDPNIYSPNIAGVLVAAVKLFIIYLYAGKTKAD